MVRWLKRLFATTLGLGLLGLLVYAFLPQPVPVDVGRVVRGGLRVTIDEDGKTRIRQRYIISLPLAGRMQRVPLKAGDAVQSGQTVLTTLEPLPPELLDERAVAQAEARVRAAKATRGQTEPALQKAQAELEFAQADLKRARELHARKTLTPQELDEKVLHERVQSEELRIARWARDVAQFELEQAEAALLRTRPGEEGDDSSQLEIRSPVSGRVLRVFRESAGAVTPGTQLLEIGDPSDLEVEVDVLSSDSVKIHSGARMILEQWGGERPLEARVRLVEPAAFTKVSALGVEEQRVWVIGEFETPLEDRPGLGDAYRVEARIVVWEGENLLKVPTSALFRQGDAWAVYVVEDGRARQRGITLGHRNGLEAEVLSGLDEHSQVIEHPSDKIHAGVLVVPR